ncbi:MAG: NUDIX hydrolase [Clostridiales bacterium]|nr:NUDIX hydrolase [Eubacteriales bacterium]MDH7565394.1 NUDIX hydrolase [Clostridiales bacterium]
MIYDEKTVESREVYKGGIISVNVLDVVLPDGKRAKRDVVRHPGASVIIPLSEDSELYMVRQFRKPIERETLELPAGKLDSGEDPKECAKRELKEETGLEAEEMKPLISLYSTPGFSDEILHMFVATGLKEGKACADEDEFISWEKIPVKKLVDMVLNHEVTDGKTIIGILLAEKIVKGEIAL